MASETGERSRQTDLVRSLRAFAWEERVPLLVFAVFLVGGVAWLIHPWYPIEDLAITELSVRHVRDHPPLSGAYSSLPFRHPGPLLFLSLWGPYEAFGERSSALLAATIWFNGATLALILSLARRLAGPWLPPVLVGVVLVWVRALDRPLLLEPWNPYMGALPIIALVLLVWALLDQRRWALPAAAGVATWLVQAHIQFAPTVAVLALVGVAGLVVGQLRAHGRAGLKPLLAPFAVSDGLALLLWSPVIYDLLANGSDSNVAALIRHYRGPQPPTVQRSDAVNIIRSQLSLQPTWAGGPRPFAYYLNVATVLTPWAAPIWLVAFALACVRRAWREVSGMAVAFLGFATAAFALTRVTGNTFGRWYLIAVEAMSLTTAAFVLVSLAATVRWAWSLWRARGADKPAAEAADSGSDGAPAASGRRHRATQLVAAGLTLAAAVGIVGSLRHSPPDLRAGDAAMDLIDDVEAAVPEGSPVFVQGGYEFGAWIHASLVLQLDRAGYETYAASLTDDKFPRPMEDDPPADAVQLVVAVDPPSTDWGPAIEVVAQTTFSISETEDPIDVYVLKRIPPAPSPGP